MAGFLITTLLTLTLNSVSKNRSGEAAKPTPAAALLKSAASALLIQMVQLLQAVARPRSLPQAR